MTNAKKIVLEYLDALQRRDLEAAQRFVADQVTFTFPGGRKFSGVEEIFANSGKRYRSVAKDIEHADVFPDGARAIVLVTGTLYGAFPDGASFAGIRFIDLFELRDGRIVSQKVWNDAGEYILARQKSDKAAST